MQVGFFFSHDMPMRPFAIGCACIVTLKLSGGYAHDFRLAGTIYLDTMPSRSVDFSTLNSFGLNIALRGWLIRAEDAEAKRRAHAKLRSETHTGLSRPFASKAFI